MEELSIYSQILFWIFISVLIPVVVCIWIWIFALIVKAVKFVKDSDND